MDKKIQILALFQFISTKLHKNIAKGIGISQLFNKLEWSYGVANLITEARIFFTFYKQNNNKNVKNILATTFEFATP